MRIEVENINDPRLDAYRDLKSRSGNLESLFVAEGAYLVERLARSAHEVLSILTTPTNADSASTWVEDDVPIYCLSPTEIRNVVGFDFHRGMLACGRRPIFSDPRVALADLIDTVQSNADHHVTLLVLPKTHDPANLGGMLRAAAAFGVTATILGTHCADPLSRRVIRTSMGSSLEVLTIRVADIRTTIDQLRQSGFHVAATTLDEAATPIAKASRTARLAIVMGPEGDGLSAELVEACDSNLTIPIRTNVDSLNVTVATGIFLQHFCGQFIDDRFFQSVSLE